MFDEYGNIKVLGGSTYRFSRENDCPTIAIYSRGIIGYSLNNRAMLSAYVLWADGKYLKLKLHLNDFWDSTYSRASFFALFGGKKHYLPLCSKIWLHLMPKRHILRHTALILGETLVITSPLYSGVKMNFVWESKFCRESLINQGLKTR